MFTVLTEKQFVEFEDRMKSYLQQGTIYDYVFGFVAVVLRNCGNYSLTEANPQTDHYPRLLNAFKKLHEISTQYGKEKREKEFIKVFQSAFSFYFLISEENVDEKKPPYPQYNLAAFTNFLKIICIGADFCYFNHVSVGQLNLLDEKSKEKLKQLTEAL